MRTRNARRQLQALQPGYDAYLDDPNEFTTGFGYGTDPGADTPAADEPDMTQDEMDRLVDDGLVTTGLVDGLVLPAMVRDGPARVARYLEPAGGE